MADHRNQRDRDTERDVGVARGFDEAVISEHERRNARPPAEDRERVIAVGGGGRAQGGPQADAGEDGGERDYR